VTYLKTLLMLPLKTKTFTAAFLVAVAAGAIPWLRLFARGHVEFCAGECNPHDWFDHAETIGYFLSLGIPTAILCLLIFRFNLHGDRNLRLISAWSLVLVCAICSTARLAFLEQAYFDQF
jgi:hypothetical protein